MRAAFSYVMPIFFPAVAPIYAHMAARLAGEPVPAATTYDEVFTPRGLVLRIIQTDGISIFHVGFSSKGSATTFHVVEMPGQDIASVTDAGSNQAYRAVRPFWSPAWPVFPENTGYAPTVLDTTRARMLNDLRDPSAGGYTVRYAGVTNLGGVPAYHLHLTASDTATHPLTDVYVDESTSAIRSALGNFSYNDVPHVTGTLQLDFGNVNGFWGIVGGTIQATAHALGTQVSGSATFALVSHQAQAARGPV